MLGVAIRLWHAQLDRSWSPRRERLVGKSATSAGAALSRTEEKMVGMCNGYICCTLREYLQRGVKKLATEVRLDYLLVEPTGIGEPLPVACVDTIPRPAAR